VRRESRWRCRRRPDRRCAIQLKLDPGGITAAAVKTETLMRLGRDPQRRQAGEPGFQGGNFPRQPFKVGVREQPVKPTPAGGQQQQPGEQRVEGTRNRHPRV
jgi:hypothetical protein